MRLNRGFIADLMNDARSIENELLDCPRCGGDTVAVLQSRHNGLPYVGCFECGFRTKTANSADELLKEWNEKGRHHAD